MNYTNHQYSLRKSYNKNEIKTNQGSYKFRKTAYKVIVLRNQFYLLAIKRLIRKYKTNKVQTYLKKVINHLIFNEKFQIVARFKDYLILDDCCEFLKR